MTTMQPVEQLRTRSNVALAMLLVLSNLFFCGCVASRYSGVLTGSPYLVSQPEKIFMPDG